MMSGPRFLSEQPLQADHEQRLDDAIFRHAVQVLRLGIGDELVLFDGQGSEACATLTAVAKREARVHIGKVEAVSRESPLAITLYQGVSRGDKMDFTIQKAVELGVTRIVPLISERCNVRMDAERWDKKIEHWRGVVTAACEQCGRNTLPALDPAVNLDTVLAEPCATASLILDPTAGCHLTELPDPAGALRLLIGPEGGLSNAEISRCLAAGWTGLQLGPRVLRTETAGLVVLAAVQARWGDLG